MIDMLWRASKSGDTIREDWLDEFVRHPEGFGRIQTMMAEADEPTRLALAGLLHEFADAPRRNASKPRRKTTEPGASWQRELANYLHREGPGTRRAKYLHIPKEHEEPLSLGEGKFEVSRRKGESRVRGKDENREAKTVDLIRCEFDDGRVPEEISFSTFERYLKNPKP